MCLQQFLVRDDEGGRRHLIQEDGLVFGPLVTSQVRVLRVLYVNYKCAAVSKQRAWKKPQTSDTR